MNRPQPRDSELIETIAKNWAGPAFSESQALRFERELHAKLSEQTLPRRALGFGWALALASLTLVFGWHTMTDWAVANERQDAAPTLEVTERPNETLTDLWASHETELDDESLPGDYIILSQLID